ncbi:patatin-like phospholipase domain-containing protein c [Polychytrium aggregatum]|uniref:patatin-like phospholipase domain-containing protein c n=1 Tax=Polychytrium aggregatum TaxID=110093 RepID=UPI0022FE195A|nr:patatin-like phospholipase domain-containing protein c [Polychytrium aggregatum]KAI9209586.1 patatin-like phospholipase domain-containing protein c [Polychytrium aggregatum]
MPSTAASKRHRPRKPVSVSSPRRPARSSALPSAKAHFPSLGDSAVLSDGSGSSTDEDDLDFPLLKHRHSATDSAETTPVVDADGDPMHTYAEDQPEPASYKRFSSSQLKAKVMKGSLSARRSIMHALTRWPLLLFVFCAVLIDLIFYITVRNWVSWWEYLVTWRGHKRQVHDRIHKARQFEEWESAAKELDDIMGNDEWKKEKECSYYDYKLIDKISRRLRRHRLSGTPGAAREMRKILQHSACKANIGGIENETLYSRTYLGTKSLVEEFVAEVLASLEFVVQSEDLSLEEKRIFLKSASRTYGKTAFCLSGGATFGYYSLGVVKALHEHDLLPNVITGTSAGSLVAAMICTRTDDELRSEIFTPDLYRHLRPCSDSVWTRTKRFWTTGSMFNSQDWYEKVKWITKGHLTFMEAYKRTGRVLNIAVVATEPHSPPKLLNYITAPDVIISSAILASAAIPGILDAVELISKTEKGDYVPFRGVGKRWRDGSLRTDIPERELHQLFNINYTIVSQCNPHILVFFYQGRGSPGYPVAHRHGRGWRGGFLASAIIQHFKLDLLKWLRLLRDLDLLPKVMGTDLSRLWLQRFEGSVTILPQPILEDYLCILTDPTRDRMVRYLSHGQVRCWPKLHMISNRLRIEQLLRRLGKQLSARTGATSGKPADLELEAGARPVAASHRPGSSANCNSISSIESVQWDHKPAPPSPVENEWSSDDDYWWNS